MLVALAVSCAWADEPRELLANGGFELLNADGGAENWGLRDWGDSKMAAAKVVGGARSGQRCMRMVGASGPLLFGCFSHPVTLGDPAPAELFLTLYYRTEGETSPDVAVTTFAEDFSLQEWKTPALTSEALGLDPSSNWRRLTWHVRLLPSARQAIVVARIHGAGALVLDDVSLKAYPTEVQCEVVAPGLVASLKGDRQCRLRLTNHASTALPVRVQLEIEAEKGPRGAGATNLTLSPGAAESVNINTSYPLDKPATLHVAVTDDKATVTYDQVDTRLPGLIDGQIDSPAFRGTILQRVPLTEISASGVINALPEVRKLLRIDGRLVGLGVDLPDMPVDAEGLWQAKMPMTGMLTGAYALQLTASQNGRRVTGMSLPFLKPEPRPGEAGYDQRLRFHLGSQMSLPLGVFLAVDETDFAAVAEAGFNTLVLPARLASSAAMDAAEKLGLTVIISSANSDESVWKNLCGKYADLPFFAGWYILQRPEAQLTPVRPESIAVIREGLTEQDPRHPVCLAVGSLSRVHEYAPFCDVLMPWTEPEPVGDLRSVDSLLQAAVAACSARKPVWPLIQMTGAAYADDTRLDPEGNGRPPTPAEYRCMAYLALARGAKGLFSYAYRLPSTRSQREFLVSRDAPGLWQMVRQVNQELRALTPVLLEGEPVAVEADGAGLPLLGLRYKDVFYVLAANPAATPAVLSLTVPGMQTSQLEVAFDARKVAGSGAGQFVDQIEPHGVRVYMGR